MEERIGSVCLKHYIKLSFVHDHNVSLQESDGLLLTPFERNIEVWRQLWRVLERSHLVVQIVDARNPLRFRCEDLEAYVQDVEGAEGEAGTGRGKRRSLLLINKAVLVGKDEVSK